MAQDQYFEIAARSPLAKDHVSPKQSRNSMTNLMKGTSAMISQVILGD